MTKGKGGGLALLRKTEQSAFGLNLNAFSFLFILISFQLYARANFPRWNLVGIRYLCP